MILSRASLRLSVVAGLVAGLLAVEAPAQSGGANSDALSLLLEQNQQLRQELQTLRAMVEEQGFELRRLQRDSLSRYTNMDERLSALETRAVAPISSVPQIPGNEPTAGGSLAGSTSLNPGTQIVDGRGQTSPGINAAGPAEDARNVLSSRGTLQPAVLSEQQLYQMAYDSVINSNFERSIAEFDQYLSVYPNGRFLTNAHYWKGQAFLYLERFEEAVASYEIILDEYADSAKLPDAMYGLALAYEGLGNTSQARQLLNSIKRRWPNTGVANLADTRLLTLQ